MKFSKIKINKQQKSNKFTKNLKKKNRKSKSSPKIVNTPNRKNQTSHEIQEINSKTENSQLRPRLLGKLNKLDFSLFLKVKEFLPVNQILKLLEINKNFRKIIQEKTDLVIKFKYYLALVCENQDHCENACRKSVHNDFCFKNFEKFYYEGQQEDNNMNITNSNSLIKYR